MEGVIASTRYIHRSTHPGIGQTDRVLLTISTTHSPATDLGYLLHKHPDKVQQFSQSFGTATVCYPHATRERCTAALILDIDLVELARKVRTPGGPRAAQGPLAHYVNDRPYAASSLLGVALARVFSTARAGKCAARPDLARTAIALEITIAVLPCRGGPALAHRLFEPLGWTVTTTEIALDKGFDEWGTSHYVQLHLSGTQRLSDALNQLHVLLPVFDESKHYWQGPDEVDKLLRSGAAWLATHPERGHITGRYLRHRPLIHMALTRLTELDDEPEEAVESADVCDDVNIPADQRLSLATQRHEAFLGHLIDLGATSVIDLGCGPGDFLQPLVANRQFHRIVGTDVSVRSLQQAKRRLHLDRPEVSERDAERVQLFQSALTYTDPRLAGFDAAVLMEVIEHLDEPRLGALEHVVFATARPGAVLVSTPNRDYNAVYAGLTDPAESPSPNTPSRLRHPDHRFEWDRAEFRTWCDRIATTHGYRLTIHGIGPHHDVLGHPSQLAMFTRD